MPRYTILVAAQLAAVAFAQGTGLDAADPSNVLSPAVQNVAENAASGVGYFSYEKSQLTPEVISNLTSYLEAQNNIDSNAAIFDFANASDPSLRKRHRGCKAYPDSASWPSKLVWRLFDLVLGGSLIEGVPAAAVCYPDWPQYDQAKCADLGVSWTDPAWRAAQPTEVDWPVFEGMSCLPPGLGDFLSRPNSTCELGGMPAYVVNATNVAQIQLAVNFARNLNIRLNIKNSGHDFNAKSTAGGSLSVWTLHLQDIEFLGSEYQSASGAKGPAFKVGAGITTKQIYDAAHERGLMVVGPIARTVGLAGGYSAGGGNGPLINKYGVAADQVLSMEVVLPDGSFVSADAKTNPELFFALRGGGGSTWGIVTSLVIRAYEDTTISTLTYTFGSGVDEEAFWTGIDALWQQFTTWPGAGIWSYFSFACEDVVNCTFSMAPQVAPGLSKSELEDHNAALFANLSSLGISVDDVSYNEYSGFMEMFDEQFPDTINTAGYWYFHSTSRFFPERNWQSQEKFATQSAAIRNTTQSRGSFTGYNSRPGVNSAVSQDNAVNPAWREALVFGMGNVVYGYNDTVEDMAAANKQMVDAYAVWRDVSDGTYLNEADINEPNWQQSFYGDNYDRLYDLKQKVDPWGVLYATGAVGSEDWHVTDQIEYFPMANGRLCPIGS
ncbi:FAD-linked oxidoreductase YvdP [Diaporthe eres]|uniref:FAD-binding PCMH-type domain-containing protein n=1 Tax=Diaporthe vaccinii TaxID=105482 RepID=A0ABR4EZ52_9PEZI|nr:FAD-linked oxidoreductase YvdP [Diaporthe eres]